MNKKIILSLTTTALLATSLLAFNGQSGMKQGKMMQSQKHRGGFSLIKLVMKLDLSDKQRTEIQAIIKESMQNLSNPNNAFTDSSFNKELFIKLAQKRRDTKIEHKADRIEKIYAVLNSSQKKDLKTMLDMKDIMKKNMMGSKNCNVRR